MVASGRSPGRIVCPFLDNDSQYVAFCGNLRYHRGQGYSPKKWLSLIGIEVKKWRDVAAFFDDLGVVAKTFELTVVARHHKLGQWYSLERLRDMTTTMHGQRRLNQCMIRIYGPADYLTSWRYTFAKKLGFSWIPGGEPCPFPTAEPIHGEVNNCDELRAWLKDRGVSPGNIRQGDEHLTGDAQSEHQALAVAGAKDFWDRVNRCIERFKL